MIKCGECGSIFVDISDAEVTERTKEIRADRDRLAAEVERLTKERDDLVAQIESYEESIDENLPEYDIAPDGEDVDEANYHERLEYAGDEIRRLTAQRDAAIAARDSAVAERDAARRLHGSAVAEARDIDRGRILGGVTCTRHGEPVQIDACSCPKGWMENRAWAIRAERERDTAAAQAQEDVLAWIRGVPIANGDEPMAPIMLAVAGRASLTSLGHCVAVGGALATIGAERDAARSDHAKLASLYTGLELTLRDALPDGLHLPHFRDAVDFAANELRDNRAGIAWRQAALDALADRISTTADEAFGPFPVQPADENLTAIERGIFELRQERDEAIAARDAAVAERDELRAIVDPVRGRELIAELQQARDSAVNDTAETIARLMDLYEREEGRFDLATFFDSKAAWSLETFGPGDRYAGVVAHIRKELDEIEATPADPVEWVDVVLLAMDGAWRSAGMTGAGFVGWMKRKDEVNRLRTWPDWRTLKPGEVSEHVKPAPSSPGASEPSEADVEAVARRMFFVSAGYEHDGAIMDRRWLDVAREAVRLGADPGRAR